jgi:predicted component of type VI protein secretion system
MVHAFKTTGWCHNIGIAQEKTPLAIHTGDFTMRNQQIPKLPVQVFIPEESEDFIPEEVYARHGFIPLVYRDGAGENKAGAIFCGSRSIRNSANPIQYELAYTLLANRIAHCVKLIGRQYIGHTAAEHNVQQELTRWLLEYVTSIQQPSTDRLFLYYYPLKQVSIDIRSDQQNLGRFQCIITMIPHNTGNREYTISTNIYQRV